jgi:hypothetical protein
MLTAHCEYCSVAHKLLKVNHINFNLILEQRIFAISIYISIKKELPMDKEYKII